MPSDPLTGNDESVEPLELVAAQRAGRSVTGRINGSGTLPSRSGPALHSPRSRYWWVNQNQTYGAESAGGFLWSPKRKRDGARNRFYDNMREVSPGDLIFSFRNTFIPAVSVAVSRAYDAPRPEDFGAAGDQWEDSGWRVDASYTVMQSPVRPKEHMSLLAPLLPDRYAPLQPNGDGLQAVYLAEISEDFANALLGLLRSAGNRPPSGGEAGESEISTIRAEAIKAAEEDRITRAIEAANLNQTEKEALVQSRRGQGLFRLRVQRFERACRVTGVAAAEFLIASHIKPWRKSTNPERLDGENGLMLTPTIDRLFDRGFVSFRDSGELVSSPVLDPDIAARLGIMAGAGVPAQPFTPGQCRYLDYHRQFVFKKIDPRQ